MSDILRRFVLAPTLGSEERTLQARTLFRVVWSTLGIVVVVMGLLIFEEPETFARRLGTVLVVTALGGLSLGLTRRDRTRLASWLFVGGLIAILSWASFTSGGMSAPQTSGFVVMVLLAGMLLGTRGGVIVAAACAGISLGMVIAEGRAMLPPSALVFSPFSIWLYGGIWMALAIVMQNQIAWTLGHALRRAEAELAERKQAQARMEESYQALRLSEEKFSRLFTSVPAGLAVSGLADGRFIDVNEAFVQIFGWSRDEVIGRTSVEMGMWVDPTERTHLVSALEAEGGEKRDVELRLRGKDGRLRVVRNSAQVLVFEGEKVMVGAFLDVTERKRAEDALRVSERRFGTIFQESPVALTVTDADSARLLEVNRAFLELIGAASADGVLGRTRAELGLAAPETSQYVRDQIVDGQARGLIVPLKRLDGSDYVGEASVADYEIDGARYRLTSTLDITPRLRAEQEREKLLFDLGERVKELRLLHQTARLLQGENRSLRELLTEWVALVPPAWRFPECCEARVSFGDIVVGTPGWRPTPWIQSAPLNTSEGAGLIEVVYLEERPEAVEGPFLGEERTLIDSLAEMLVGYLELRRHREGLEDLVARRTVQLRAAKEEADRANRAKGTFLATMSHEIRTPMNSILGNTQLLRRDRSLNDEQRRKVSVILSSGDHLLALINNVLEMSRMEAGRTTLTLQTVNLHGLLDGIEQMFATLASAKGLSLAFDRAVQTPGAVQGDASKIRQVLINLLGNAVKFTERGGVSVRTSSRGLPGVGYRIAIAVEDTGPGIDADDLPRIFGAFEQLGLGVRTGGSGLGLAISREFARLMGGDLTVESTVGKGSTFTFTFEAAWASSQDAEHASEEKLPVGLEGTGPPPKILVVDDQPEGRDAVAEMLAVVGFDVRQATTGEEGIEVHDAWRPNLVLMDLRMPGIGGIEAIRRLRRARTEAVVVAFTAGSIEGVVLEAEKAGAIATFMKPYRESELLDAIGEWLGVKYVYEKNEPRPKATPEPTATTPLSSLLGGVPAQLIEQLKAAAIEARAARIEQLAQEVAAYSSVAAEQIRALGNDFRYDRLVTALDEVSAAQAGTAASGE